MLVIQSTNNETMKMHNLSRHKFVSRNRLCIYIMMTKYILLSLIGTAVFGITDSLFFLFAEEILEKKISEFQSFDEVSVPLIINGIAGSISIFATSLINNYFLKSYDLIHHPVLDSLGIILGASIVLFIYKMVKFSEKKSYSL